MRIKNKRPYLPLFAYFASDIQEINENFKTITIRWEKESKIPTIRYKWYRLEDGRIQAIYTRDELAKCLEVYEITHGKEPG